MITRNIIAVTTNGQKSQNEVHLIVKVASYSSISADAWNIQKLAINIIYIYAIFYQLGKRSSKDAG